MELEEKFHCLSVILEVKFFNAIARQGMPNPFDLHNQVIICSYQFAAARSDYISRITLDLAVLDEAHRLQNVYRKCY